MDTSLLRFDFAAFLLTLCTISLITVGLYRWVPWVRRVPGVAAWHRQAAALWPVVGAVLLFRAWVFEPFRIPSGSMEPSLLTGDFIVVNKFVYGIHAPLVHRLMWPVHTPQRGDVAVFRYPKDIRLDYIKRVVGIPGDTVAYLDKTLWVNGKPVAKTLQGEGTFYDAQGMTTRMQLWEEALEGGTAHSVYENPLVWGSGMAEVEVPPGYYVVLGDNRDASGDSRAWGFVPASHLLGKAVRVWLSWDAVHHRVRWSRIGQPI